MFAAAKSRLCTSRSRSISGSEARRSTKTKPTSDAAARSRRATLRAPTHPHCGAKVSGTRRQTRKPPSSAAPATSGRADRGAARSSRGRRRQPQAKRRAPIGTLIRKTDCQPKASVRTPPSGGPALRPRYTAATLMPRARPRSWGGKAAVTIATDVAPSSADPTPCTPREPISQAPFRAHGAQQRPGREHRDPDQVEAHAPALVGEPSQRDEQRRHHDQVRGLHPHRGAEAQAEVAADRGQGDRGDGPEKRVDESADAGEREQLPASALEVVEGGGSRCHGASLSRRGPATAARPLSP